MKGDSKPSRPADCAGCLQGARAGVRERGPAVVPRDSTATAPAKTATATQLTPPGGRDLPFPLANAPMIVRCIMERHSLPLPPTARCALPVLPGMATPRPGGGDAGRRSSHGSPHIRHDTKPRRIRDDGEVVEWLLESGLLSIGEGIPDCCGPTDHAGSTVHPRKCSRLGPPGGRSASIQSTPNRVN